MYSIERKSEIIKFLEKDKKVEVNALAALFRTSKETIRRDLKDLEEQGILTRTHGGAVLRQTQNTADIQEYPLAVRGIQNYREKQEICKKAVSFIGNGDTIFVDNSSTTMYLIQFLPANLHVTFITNSIKFLTEAAKYDCTNKIFMCLGGMYNPKNLSTFASTASLQTPEYYPDKCFISCAGISAGRMCTDTSLYEVGTKKRMIDASKEVFLLADHTKFDFEGQFFLTDFSCVSHIITDCKTDVQKYPYLQNQDIVFTSDNV